MNEKNDKERMPFVSIVIANYNYGKYLEEALNSLFVQTCQDFEIIVCDGGSTDNSVDIIRKHSDKIVWWCSEKDGGQSAAFNKGFSHARGKFLTWLNADDVLLPRTIEKLKAASERRPDCEWFVGGVLWLDPEMRIINCGRGRRFSTIRYKEGNVSVWGPSSFFTKRLLDMVGGVDERFHFAMDSDLWLRFACKANARYRPFCDYAWGLRLHPEAKMSSHNFTEDGNYDGKGAEKDKIKRNKNFLQIKQESQLMSEYFCARKGTFISRILSMDFIQVLAARIDIFRMSGHHYKEVFK